MSGSILDFFHESGEHFGFGHYPHLLALAENNRPAGASGDSHVGVLGLAGSVDLAAHNGHLDFLVAAFDQRVHIVGQFHHVYVGAAAAGAGDQRGALVPQVQ